jgi:hypothetical protein
VAGALELAERMATNTILNNFAIVPVLSRIARVGGDSGTVMENLKARSAQAMIPMCGGLACSKPIATKPWRKDEAHE